MYNVIKFFTDLQDDNHPYEVGSTYPREGLSVTRERIEELKSKNNKQGFPLITGTDVGVNIIEKKVKKEKEVKVEETKEAEPVEEAAEEVESTKKVTAKAKKKEK